MALSAQSRSSLKGIMFVSPWICGFLLFTLIPTVLSLYFSFCDYPLLQPPLFRGLENYRKLAENPDFAKSALNTFYFAVLLLPASMVVALGCALLLNTKIRGQSIYRTLIFLPSLVPLVASSVLWMWMYNTRYGLVNMILGGLGKQQPIGWLSDPKFVMPALAMMSLWGVGNTVIIYLAGLQEVPKDLYEASELDGAGPLGQLLHVTIPSISPVIFFNLIIGIIAAMQVFVPALVMTTGGPAHATYFYTYFLYDNAFSYFKMGQASAMAWILLLMTLALTGLAFWSSKHWVHYQGK